MAYKQIDKYGTVRYYNEHNQLHREDGPAVELANGDKEWYQNGKRHRLDGPAIQYASGTKIWWFENKAYSQEEFEQLPHIKFINQQLKEFDEIQKQGI